MSQNAAKLFLTLVIGFFGALLATWLKLPAAALVGATTAVSVASLLRLTVNIPDILRNLAFVVVGCSLGSGITSDIFSQAVRWPASLFVLSVAVLSTLFVSSWVLIRFYGQKQDTALLSTSPGALAYTLALATDGIGNLRTIIVVQSIRLLLITTLLPLVLDHFNLRTDKVLDSSKVSMTNIEFSGIILIGLCVGWLLLKFSIPASFFLAGMLASGIMHFSGIVNGRPSEIAFFIGFALTGTVIGARFSSIPIRDLKQLFWASTSVFLTSSLVMAAFSLLSAAVLSIPFGQVFVAFAPGGVEAMAAMALSLGYDPAFVAVHHMFRIFFLLLVLPLLLRISSRIVNQER